MMEIHSDIFSRFLKSPRMGVLYNDKLYMPICFTLTRARSAPAHHIFDYVRDEYSIYYVSGGDDRKLIPLSMALAASFSAISWHLAKDDNSVYLRSKKKKGIKNPSQFKKLDQEFELFSDTEFCYDRELNTLPLDLKTLQLIPLAAESRKKKWEIYNQYLTSANQPILPFENSTMYSSYILDKKGLYEYQNHHLTFLDKDEVEAVIRGPETDENRDVLNYLKENSQINSYSWLKI